jgi:acyl dehydratase
MSTTNQTPTEWTIEEFLRRQAGPIGVSGWLTVSRPQLAEFARASRLTADAVDLSVSLNNRWGSDLVDGFLLVSLLVHFEWATVRLRDEGAWALNYGLDRVRFIAPVFVGERIRDHIQLLDATPRNPGQVLVRTRHEIEIEGKSRPALSADWLSLYLTGDLEAVR